ncbi:MAG: ABC transporter permease [Bdellovibrionaceae bacterium]|nr:ABC transporter permease [Pseudobdellovibrionaceae bacterium]MDW8191169.1 ABC transporter permease [Pseudobdellovibrionaceae bacterium]
MTSWVGQVIQDYWRMTSGSWLLNYFSIRWLFSSGQLIGFRQVIRVTASQIYFTAAQALPLVIFLGFGVGFVFITQLLNPFFGLANVEMATKLFFNLIIKEAAPLLTIMIVVARSITAIATELGNMKINREIEALLSMSIHPISFVVLPRLAGGVTSLVILGVFFCLFSLFGALFSGTWFYRVPPVYFFNTLIGLFHSHDFVFLLLKLTGSGLFIFSIATYFGLSPKSSPSEVPICTTHAVVKSIVVALVFSGFLTVCEYLSVF